MVPVTRARRSGCSRPACVRVSGGDLGTRAAAEISRVASWAQLLSLRGSETWGWNSFPKEPAAWVVRAGGQSSVRVLKLCVLKLFVEGQYCDAKFHRPVRLMLVLISS
jgi:hypothetical protein